MNYSQIEAFVDLVETKSFSQTAHRLNVSQPAISQRITALEKSMNCQLFERRGDDLVVTQAGNYLYEQGKAIIAMWDATFLQIQNIKDSPYGNLSIGASTIPAQFFIAPIIKKFRNTYPHIQIQLHVAGTQQVIRWLQDKKVDIAVIGSKPQDDKTLSYFAVAKDQLQLIVPLNHPWAKRQSIAINELKDATFIMREKESGTRKILQAALEEHGISIDSLSILGEFGSTDAVIAAVESELGVSFVSKVAADRAIDLHKVKAIIVDNLLIERNLYCATKHDHNSLATTKFIEFITDINKTPSSTT